MRKMARELIPLVHLLGVGALGSAVVLLSLVPMMPASNPLPAGINACEGGAICEPWMELLEHYRPPRAAKQDKLKVRPSRRLQFG